MSSRIPLLAALLAAQLAIIALVFLLRGNDAATDSAVFLDFEPALVDRVSIADGDGDVAVLVRRAEGDDGGWELEGGHPADSVKIDDLLEDLASLKAPWPVATTTQSAQRFEVTGEDYQRHVVFSAADKPVADFYLGTSPGYRRVHARREAADEVFSIDFSNYQAPTAADDWLDKSLLAAAGEITSVARVDAWQAARSEEGWLIDAEAADSDAVDQLVDSLTSLRVMGPTEEPGEPQFELEVTDADGVVRYSISQVADEEEFVIASDRRDGHFRLASYNAGRLDHDREDLLPEVADDAAAATEPAVEPVADEGAGVENLNEPQPDAAG
jgi:hypothetical protein